MAVIIRGRFVNGHFAHFKIKTPSTYIYPWMKFGSASTSRSVVVPPIPATARYETDLTNSSKWNNYTGATSAVTAPAIPTTFKYALTRDVDTVPWYGYTGANSVAVASTMPGSSKYALTQDIANTPWYGYAGANSTVAASTLPGSSNYALSQDIANTPWYSYNGTSSTSTGSTLPSSARVAQ